MPRGRLVRGRLTDKATGKPVPGIVEYFVFQDNPYLAGYPNSQRESLALRTRIGASDAGGFTIPALPGRGLIAARAKEERYLRDIGAAAIKGRVPELQLS